MSIVWKSSQLPTLGDQKADRTEGIHWPHLIPPLLPQLHTNFSDLHTHSGWKMTLALLCFPPHPWDPQPSSGLQPNVRVLKALAGVRLCIGCINTAPLALSVSMQWFEICPQILGHSLHTANPSLESVDSLTGSWQAERGQK